MYEIQWREVGDIMNDDLAHGASVHETEASYRQELANLAIICPRAIVFVRKNKGTWSRVTLKAVN